MQTTSGFRLFPASLFLFLLSLSMLQAQSTEKFAEKKFLVTGFVGAHVSDLGDEFQDAGADLDPDVLFGGRFEYRFTPRWGVEGSVSFSPVAADLLSAAGGPTESDVDTWDITGNIVYHISPAAAVDPYLTGGLGARVLDIENGDTESFFAGNFGGGVFVPVSQRIAFRGDSRFFVYNVDDLDPSSAAALGVAPDFDETVWDFQVSGGITFAF